MPVISRNSNQTRLALGFDASCGKCRSMAKQLESDVGSSVDVLPLNNSDMSTWRHQAFDDPPWAPTLVRVGADNNATDGWVGWKIGPVLGSELGPQRAAKALSNIGEQRLAANGGRFAATRDTETSRRGLVRLAAGVAGVAAGAATVAGMSGAAFAKGKPQNLQISEDKALDDDAAVEKLRTQLETTDAKNVVQYSAVAASSTGISGLYQTSSSGSQPEVGAKRMTLKDGTVSEMSFTYDKDSGELLIVQEHTEIVDGRASIAWIVDVEEDPNDYKASTFTVREQSVNGSLVRRLNGDVEAIQKADDDPCGGCNGVCQISGEEFRESCHTSSVVGCLLTAAGCATCVGCSGTGWCIACAITSFLH